MKAFFMVIAIFSFVFAEDFYEDSAGNKYRYDTSDPYDAIDYGTDMYQQLEDDTYRNMYENLRENDTDEQKGYKGIVIFE